MMLKGAPENKDIELFNEVDLLRATTNCYAYAVQDYGAGLIDTQESPSKATNKNLKTDFNYMPRPGQTKGKSYEELFSIQPTDTKDWAELRKKVMRLALKQDGVLYQGTKYPKFVPDDKYVICCFLEPNSYHFIRQNQDGSWSSKNGVGEVTNKADDNKTPLGDNPEKFYNFDPKYPFVGYFFVPKGGIRIGLKSYLSKLPRINKLHLIQILQKEGQTQNFAPQMLLGQKHIEKAISTFKDIYDDIENLRQLFSKTPTTDEKKALGTDLLEDIKQKINKATVNKSFELRSFLKERQEVSSSRRSKILKKSAER